MAQTWKYAIGLGLLSATLAVGCTVTSGDDDDNGGSSGEGGTGGSSGKGGTGGTTGGTGGTTGGSSTGGSAGTGGSTGGSAGSGTGGATGGTGTGGTDGGTAGTGESGTGGTDSGPTATCDPSSGDLPSKDADSCAPSDNATGDDLKCQQCMASKCCAETKTCYGEDPYNVCGWGGPTTGTYAGYNEIGCFIACLRQYVKDNDTTCDSDGTDECASECATTMCFDSNGEQPLPGNATNDLIGCVTTNCPSDCVGADSCD